MEAPGNPLVSHCFLFTMALTGCSQLRSCSNGEGTKTWRGLI